MNYQLKVKRKDGTKETLDLLDKATLESELSKYLQKIGGTLSGELLFDSGTTTQSKTKGLKWRTINNHTPYFGYSLDQVDGTFVWSINGTNYASGLAIDGGSGNLLWKGNKVATTNDISNISKNYLPLSGGTMQGELIFNGMDATGGSKIVLETGKGQITNSTTNTLFGYTSDTQLVCGHSSFNINIRGKATRPTYNNNDIALYSDLSNVENISSLETRVGNVETNVQNLQNQVNVIDGNYINQDGLDLALEELKTNAYYSVSNEKPTDEYAKWNIGNIDAELQFNGSKKRPTYYSEDSYGELAFLSDIPTNSGTSNAFKLLDSFTLTNGTSNSPTEIDVSGYSENYEVWISCDTSFYVKTASIDFGSFQSQSSVVIKVRLVENMFYIIIQGKEESGSAIFDAINFVSYDELIYVYDQDGSGTTEISIIGE